MKTIISGAVSFLAIGVLWVMFVLPFMFNLIYGLFSEGGTLATIVALVVCVIVAYAGVQLGILLAFLIGATVGALTDEL